MRVYNFLSANWALKDLEKKRIKVSFLEDLNDPFEFLALDTSDPVVDTALNATRYTLGQTRGVLCFSRAWSNPVLWSHYGDKHKGIALGFDIPDLIDGEWPLIDVSYVLERLKYSANDLQKWNELDMHKLLATKFEHWKYEDEVRVYTSIKERDKKSGFCFVPFSDNLTLVEVILGVRCKVAQNEIHHILKNYLPGVKIIESKLDERTFSVLDKFST
jgi:hypothetical protein